MADVSDYAYGVQIVKNYAYAGGGDAIGALNYFLNTYGKDTITSIGARAKSVPNNVLTDFFKKSVDEHADADKPAMSSINTAILLAGGETPGIFTTGLETVKESADAFAETAKDYIPSGATVKYALLGLGVVIIVASFAYIAHVAAPALKKA